ncbi:MAG: metallophosphoesterase [Cytophagales bacterium]|nr:metallophosphoesterase [Cytophagales bacterium]
MNKLQKGILTGIAGALAGGFAYAAHGELNQLEVTEYAIGKPERGGTPLRLLHLSDLHLRYHLGPRHLRLLETVRRLRPDLILLTGDAVDQWGTAFPLDRFLQGLPAEVPKAAILGNHDYKSGIDIPTFRRLYAHYNGALLVNESVTYAFGNTRLVVTGLDDGLRGVPDLARAVRELGATEHHLVLIHRPLQQEDVLRQLPGINAGRPPDGQLNVKYLLAGHTHGGQITFFGYAPYLPRMSGKYIKGWFNRQPPLLYVSRGFGASLVPLRYGAPPEITLFHYYP